MISPIHGLLYWPSIGVQQTMSIRCRPFRSFSCTDASENSSHASRRIGGKLVVLIDQWKPSDYEITLTPRWVSPPEWLVTAKGLPKIRSRMTRGGPEWKLSDKTKRDWAKILVLFIRKVAGSIEETSRHLKNLGTNEDPWKTLQRLNSWCRLLYYFVAWKAGIVKDLLTKTNMVYGIATRFMPVGTGDSRCLV